MYERLCKKTLERNGHLVHLVPPSQRFQKSVDLFHQFDILSIKADTKQKFWIQVKYEYKSGIKTYMKLLKQFKDTYLHENDVVQLWNWRKKSKRIKNGWDIRTV